MQCLLFCPILRQTETYRQIVIKIPNTKFRENPLSGRGDVPCGQKDGHNAASSHYSLTERAKNALKKWKKIDGKQDKPFKLPV